MHQALLILQEESSNLSPRQTHPGNLPEQTSPKSPGSETAAGGTLGTLHLCLVDDEVLGGPAALKILASALLRAQLLVLTLVQGEERGGEAAVAGRPREGRQRVFLWGARDGAFQPE